MAQRDQLLFEEGWRCLLGGAGEFEVLGGAVVGSRAGDGGDWREVSFGVDARRTNG